MEVFLALIALFILVYKLLLEFSLLSAKKKQKIIDIILIKSEMYLFIAKFFNYIGM